MSRIDRHTSMNKIVCPACEREITEQAPIEIPTSDMETTPSIRVDRSASTRGSNPASIYFSNGRYYLVLETMCSCPYCHTYFELDLPTNLPN